VSIRGEREKPFDRGSLSAGSTFIPPNRPTLPPPRGSVSQPLDAAMRYGAIGLARTGTV